ncbi:uncharacterized protein UBRO2_00006 [Ustilago bromivora]|uniref:Uncharacterized protein n=2 Tax=Ustilago bromivora TaxID=307758 RepID=A0A8H8QG87_9BASI|nr:uncharacterized protein UBRO2_00006 [Ustilago bromivora]
MPRIQLPRSKLDPPEAIKAPQPQPQSTQQPPPSPPRTYIPAPSTSPMQQDHHHPAHTTTASNTSAASILTSLRQLLFSLLISTPPTLTPAQLSPDLRMRHQMLSLPSIPPLAYDLVERSVLSGGFPSPAYLSATHDERIASQHAFTSYLSRPPVELVPNASSVDVNRTSVAFFFERMTAMQVALCGEEDPVKVEDFGIWCKEDWHGTGEGAGRVVVRFPNKRCGGSLGWLCLMLVLDGDEGKDGVRVKLDNLFRVEEWDEARKGLHEWTEGCMRARGKGMGKGKQRAISTDPEQEQEGEEGEEGGAEYIIDANDFWAGFWDEDEAEADEEDEVGTVAGSNGVVIRNSTTSNLDPATRTEQEKAIQDIIRGAFTLYRRHNTTADAKDSFVDLVLGTIS